MMLSADIIMSEIIHDKYKKKINKKPKHQCEVCLSNYFKYGKKRSPVIKTKIIKSKRIYNRKKK